MDIHKSTQHSHMRPETVLAAEAALMAWGLDLDIVKGELRRVLSDPVAVQVMLQAVLDRAEKDLNPGL